MRSFLILCLVLTALEAASTNSLSVRQTGNTPTGNSTSWPDPEPCTGNCTYVHDPALIKCSDGTWFRLSTNGNIAIASAPTINGPWTYQGAMLPQGSIINLTSDQELWAPDVSFINDTFYVYYAVSTLGSQTSQIGLATSATLDQGSFTDHGTVELPRSTKYNLIDPNLFYESPSGPFYFSFGSAWKAIFQTTFQNPPLHYESGASVNNIAYNSTSPASGGGPSIVEGSYQFWWPVGDTKYYYLFFSSGACCNAVTELVAPGDEYKIMVCRATDPTGPFVDQDGKDCLTDNGGTLVLGSHGANVYAPGGQGVYYEAGMKGPALYYHYVNPNIGYDYEDFQFGFNFLSFDSGWPVLISTNATKVDNEPSVSYTFRGVWEVLQSLERNIASLAQDDSSSNASGAG